MMVCKILIASFSEQQKVFSYSLCEGERGRSTAVSVSKYFTTRLVSSKALVLSAAIQCLPPQVLLRLRVEMVWRVLYATGIAAGRERYSFYINHRRLH
jgi:hypothetical protein